MRDYRIQDLKDARQIMSLAWRAGGDQSVLRRVYEHLNNRLLEQFSQCVSVKTTDANDEEGIQCRFLEEHRMILIAIRYEHGNTLGIQQALQEATVELESIIRKAVL